MPREEKREPGRVERRLYEPPAIVFESPTEALAAACNPGDATCPSKDSNTGVHCSDMGIPNNCASAPKS